MKTAPTIQPGGFHLGLSGDWLVNAVSANVGEYIGYTAEAVLGQPVTNLLSNERIHDIRNRMALLRGHDSVEHLFQFRLTDDRAFDLAIYRNGTGFGIDAEPCAEHSFGDATGILQGMLKRIEPSEDVRQLCDQASNQLRALTGFQRVVISTGSKQLGQSMRAGLSATNVPTTPIGTDMVVFDRDSAAVPIKSVDAGWTSPRRLTLQSPTAADIGELAAIGAKAALVMPLDRDGQPWGQVACFHDMPRRVSAERRNIARLFAGIMALRIEIAELRQGP